MTRMHRSSRAPVLSATRRRVSCWITSDPSGSLRHLEDLGEPPALRLRERAGLDDADDVPGLGLVLLVMGVELRRAADHLLVLRVRLHGVDANDDRLVHRRGDDDASPLLLPATLGLGLGRADDRLALRGGLALGLRALPALSARQSIALLLRPALRASRLLGRSLV